MAGRPVLVPPIGALHERVQASGAGWVMQDWCNTDTILDDVLSILRPDNHADFCAKQALAKNAPITSVSDMTNSTELVYTAVLEQNEAVSATPFPNAVLHEALRKALGAASAEKKRNTSRAEHWLLRFAHLGLRLRYTLLGRILYRIVPVRLQQILKRRLLAS